MIECTQIDNLLTIFFGSIAIGVILHIFMAMLISRSSIQTKRHKKIMQELDELENLKRKKY